MRLRKNTIAMAAAACTLLITNAAQGAVIINITQVGADVVTTATGSHKLSGNGTVGASSLARGLQAGDAYFRLGVGSVTQHNLAIGGPDSWGPPSFVLATSRSSDAFAFIVPDASMCGLIMWVGRR